MRRRLLAAVGACAVLAGVVAAESPAPAPIRPAAEVLAAQLGAPSFADREAAAKALEALGPAAIPALQAAAKSPDPEVRQRASALLARLQRSADSAKRLAV